MQNLEEYPFIIHFRGEDNERDRLESVRSADGSGIVTPDGVASLNASPGKCSRKFTT